MIPTGRALLWALWLILGAGAVKARDLVQSQPGAEWAGGSEGDTITARIPNKVWANIVKRNEPGSVGKTINSGEEEEDKLVVPAAAELLENLVSVSEEERKDSLEEGRELDGDEQQEDDGDQHQELYQKEEQKQYSRNLGQGQNQAQKIEQVQNQEQGEIQERGEGEEQQEESGGEAQGQTQGFEEQRQGQGAEGQRQEEEAGGLEESQSLGHELEQIQVQAVEQPQQAQEYQQIQKPPPPPEEPAPEQLLLEAFEQTTLDLSPGPWSNGLPSPGLPNHESQQPAELEFSSTGSVPPPEEHPMMLAWGPWECHCPTGTMSRVRGGKFLGFTRRFRSGALSRLQTQRQPCTYARCHCDQEKKECPSDPVSCASTPGACNHRASLTSPGSPENTAFWKQVQEGLKEVWVGLQSLVTKEKRIKRNQR